MATDEMTVILEHFRTWLNSELHSTHSSSSALTPRLCLWSVETNTYQTWSKTSCGAAPGRAEVCASCVEICVCVCGDSLFIVASWLPSTACWHAVLSACVIVCVCVSASVSQAVRRHLFHREDRWLWFTASYRNHNRLSLLWEPIKAQLRLACAQLLQ